MKLTKRKLRQLIIQSINEAKYYIGDDKGNVQSAIGAFHGGYTKDAILGNIHRPLRDSESNTLAMKAVKMMRSKNLETRAQGRELARTIVDFGMVDDDILQDLKNDLAFTSDGSLELTDIEKTARDHMPHDKVEADRGNYEQPETLIDKGMLYGAMKSKSDGILSRFAFRYVDDIGFPPDTDYEGGGDMFRFHAKVLGCRVEDLAFVDSEEPDANATMMAIYDMMRERGATEIDIPGDIGNYGQNSLYDIDGLKVLLTGHHGGYYTATICGG